MSFLDKAKKQARQAAELAKEASEKAAARIEETGLVDKVASKVDQQTKGKYSDKIAKAAASAKDGVSRLSPGETVVSMEHSTLYGSEPTETAAEAAQVFEENPPLQE